MLVCFWQFPPHLIAGVKHLPNKISPPGSVYLQYPLPPCVMQVFHLVLTTEVVFLRSFNLIEIVFESFDCCCRLCSLLTKLAGLAKYHNFRC